jgi:hypothetical protein
MTLLRRLWVKKYSQKGATFGDADDGFANLQLICINKNGSEGEILRGENDQVCVC